MNRFLTILLACFVATHAHSQTIINRDPGIEAMTNTISADSLKATIEKLVSFGTRHTLSDTTRTGRGIAAARSWVLQQFQRYAAASGGRLTASIDTATLAADGRRVDKPTLLGNVVATLKGTDKDNNRIYIISGHLDSRVTDVMNRNADAPGANDDGSGVAAVLECARVMSTQSFPSTIIFVALSGEEQGLLGANMMAARAKKEGWNIDAVLNNDIIGSNNSNETKITDNTRLRVFSEAFSVSDTGRALQTIRSYGLENDSRSRQLARYVKEVGERYVPNLEVMLVYRNDRFLRNGDQTPFQQRGFTAVRLTEMNENYDHQHQDVRTEKGTSYGDLTSFMDFEYLRKNTAVNLAVLANLAKAPLPPAEPVFEGGLGNRTSIKWKTVAGAAGYYILVRETSSAVWQKKYFTTQTSYSLPMSRDNYFFAVQSVTAAGNESQAVIPATVR